MAIALVDQTTIQTASNVVDDSVTVTSAGFAANPVVGNHLFVLVSGWNSAAFDLSAITDNQSNSYTINAESNISSSGADTPFCGASITSAKVTTSSGTFTITVDPQDGSGNYMEWVVAEYSGLDATTHLHKTGTNSAFAAAGTDANVTASAANTEANCLVLACCSVSNSDTNLNLSDPPATGFTTLATNQDAQATIGFQSAYKIVSATETSSCTWTHDNTSAEGWAAALATYAAAAGAATKAMPPYVNRQMRFFRRR